MRIISTIPMLGTMMLIASEVPEIPSVLSYALQGGALVVLAWMVWYLLSRHLPAEREASREQRDAFLEFLRQEREARNK